jgi:hypothetical protein
MHTTRLLSVIPTPVRILRTVSSGIFQRASGQLRVHVLHQRAPGVPGVSGVHELPRVNIRDRRHGLPVPGGARA